MTDTDAPTPTPPATRRRALPLALVAVASLLLFVGIFAVWANRQVLNTDNWTNTSTEILERPAVRAQLAGFLVDELYANTDVTGTLREALPPRAKRLAGPAAGGLRDLTERGTEEALARPRVQAVWEQANRRAHRRLIQVLEGGGSAVSTEGGDVTIDLREVLGRTADRLGVADRVRGKLPESAAQITVLRSDQLGFVQDVLQAVRRLPIVLTVLVLALFAAAVWTARGWRREALRACGLALLGAGIAALVAKSIAGGLVVDSLARSDAAKPAVEDIWDVASSLLHEAAVATVLYGLVVILAAWMAGPTPWAVALRAALAPYLREPAYAYGGLLTLVLLVAWWGPTPATRELAPGLLLVALLVVGLEALRRQTAREHPQIDRAAGAAMRNAAATRMAARARGAFSSVGAPRGTVGAAATAASPPGEGADSVGQLERLAGLHAGGVLDDDEFRRAKAGVLGGVAAPTA